MALKNLGFLGCLKKPKKPKKSDFRRAAEWASTRRPAVDRHLQTTRQKVHMNTSQRPL